MKKILILLPVIATLGCSTPATVTSPTNDMMGGAYSPDTYREPASITATGPDDYQLERCGLPANGVFKILVNGSDVNRGGRTDASGCVKTSFRNGFLKPGNNVVIAVDGRNAASETVPGGGGGGGGNMGAGNNRPVQPPANNPTYNSGTYHATIPAAPAPYVPPAPAPYVPPADTRRPLDINKVRETAMDDARCTANAVVEAYGQLERQRYSFQIGLLQGLSLYNWQNMGDLRNAPEYSNGYAVGSGQGGSSGFGAGQNAGSIAGRNDGSLEAQARYAAVVNTGGAPNVEVPVTSVQAPGLNANLRTPPSIEARLASMTGEMQAWVNSQRFTYDGYVVVPEWNESYWSPLSLYQWQNNYQFNVVRGWYRDDWAWNLWVGQNFGRCANQVPYYTKISDSSTYTNAGSAVSEFRNQFKATYDNVIDEKWNNKVRQIEPSSQQYGITLGQRAAREYAYDVGYSNGYQISYSSQGAVGYSTTYRSSYEGAFNNTVHTYESSAVITDAVVSVKASSGGDAGVGSAIDVIVQSAKNIGRQNGEAKVTVGGEAITRSNEQTFKVEHSSSLAQPVTLSQIATIGTQTIPNASANLVVNVNSQSIQKTLPISWIVTVQNLGSAPANSELQNSLLTYVVNNLAQEWHASSNSDFKDDPRAPDRLIKQLYRAYTQASDVQKQALKGFIPQFRKAYGSKPWLSSSGWTAANSWLDRMN